MATNAGDQGSPLPSADAAAVDVFVEGAPVSASSSTVTGGELKGRPRLRPTDVLQAAGGLFAVQHAGGGKASQYFLRGFDIDHGTDLSITVDGIPVNLVSHGHGQGYADLNFLIPELVTALDVRKGTWYPQLGDFATAGAADLRLADALSESFLTFGAGPFGVLRGVAGVSKTVASNWRIVTAMEVTRQNGPFQNPENDRRFNGYLRVTGDLSPSTTLTMTWMGQQGSWNANGQLPLRAVEQGLIDRFGSLDPTEGGRTSRQLASVRLRTALADAAHLDVTAWAQRYDWRLHSNFTFLLEDPVRGDQIEQTDDRWTFGLNGSATLLHRHLGAAQIETRAGLQIRGDAIENGLFHAQARTRLEPRVDAVVQEVGAGVFAEEVLKYQRWFTVRAGARLDRLDVAVSDRLGRTGAESIDGSTGAMLVSPKASITLAPARAIDLYVNAGRGFHSNDARGATRAAKPATLLVPAMGYEVGTRVRVGQPLVLTAAAYRLDLASELVWSGDRGTTEPSGATTRLGVEFGARLNLDRWLFADVDVTLNRGTYRERSGTAETIPLAPTRTMTAGVGARAPWGMTGSLRVRHMGARPATEDGTLVANGFTIVDAQLGHRWGPFEATFDVQNVLDAAWREVQVATTSRLAGETVPTTEVHFTPGWPRTLRASLTAWF